MITIKVGLGRDPELFLVEYADAIRHHAILAIEESLELDLDEALCVEFLTHETEEHVMDFVLKRELWMQFLADSIEPLTEGENYEDLMKVRELMRKLQE